MNINNQNFPGGGRHAPGPLPPVGEPLSVSLCPYSLHYTSQLFEPPPPLLRIPGHALAVYIQPRYFHLIFRSVSDNSMHWVILHYVRPPF